MKRGKRILICFVGIDGSGKTTQARALVDMLAREGTECKYVYNRFLPFLTKPLMAMGKLFFFGGKGKFENYEAFSTSRKRVFGNPIMSALYPYLLLFDYLLQNVVRFIPQLFLGRGIICDRYIHDVVADIAVDLNLSADSAQAMLKRASILFPRPDLILLIDVPEDVAFQRKSDIPSPRYLEERRKVYLEMARGREMVILDGSQGPSDLASMIKDEVSKRMVGSVGE